MSSCWDGLDPCWDCGSVQCECATDYSELKDCEERKKKQPDNGRGIKHCCRPAVDKNKPVIICGETDIQLGRHGLVPRRNNHTCQSTDESISTSVSHCTFSPRPGMRGTTFLASVYPNSQLAAPSTILELTSLSGHR